MASLDGLHPKVREMTEELILRCKARGVNILITQGYRSSEYQNSLYAQGRTKPGNIVTNARGGSSYHNYGLAIDFCLLVNGKALWEVSKDYDGDGIADWQEVAAEGKKLGFEWGGDWKGFRDDPHFQYTFGLSISQLKAGKRPSGSVTAASSTPSSKDSILEKNETGPQVAELQKSLILLGEQLPRAGADGHYGAETVEAVKAFQARHGLKVDGVAGPSTFKKVQEEIDAKKKKETAIVPYPGTPVKLGSKGINVERIQRALMLEPDGIFGRGSEQAVKVYQTKKGLYSDGIVGEKTWNTLF